MIQQKYTCPICGFESNGPGLCPTCDDCLEKVCLCGSGKFSSECCKEEEEEKPDEKKAEELIKAEVSGEALKEKAEEDVKKTQEEEELENVEEVKDED